jgi:hypothetical protein
MPNKNEGPEGGFASGLPPKRTKDEWAKKLCVVPRTVVEAADEVQLLEVLGRATNAYAPTGLAIALALEVEAILHTRYERLDEAVAGRGARAYAGQDGLLVAGSIGVGKSRGIGLILEQFPKQIPRSATSAISGPWMQVPCLYVQCPPAASLVDFFDAAVRNMAPLIGLNLRENPQFVRHKANDLYQLFRSMATEHALGVVVVDEIQNISAQKSQGVEALKNSLVRLTQESSVPVVAIGTPPAKNLIAGSGRTARRFAERLQLWDPFDRESKEWSLVARAIWGSRALDRGRVFTDGIGNALFDASEGVPSFAQILLGDAQRVAFKREHDDDDERTRIVDCARDKTIDLEKMVKVAVEHALIGKYVVDLKRQRDLGPTACREPEVQLLRLQVKKKKAA